MTSTLASLRRYPSHAAQAGLAPTVPSDYIQACYDFNTSKIALDNAIGVPFKSPLEKTTVVKVKPLIVEKAKVEKIAKESEEE